MKIKNYLLFLLITLAPLIAVQASVNLGVSVFYGTYKTDDDGAEDEETTTMYDVKLGVSTASGVYIGGIYANEKIDFDTTEHERTSHGASLGFMTTNWYIIGHYFIGSEQDRDGTVYEGGKGFGGDLGYYFSAGSQVALGPQLSYRKFEYDETEAGVKVDVEHERIVPQIALLIRF